VHLVGFAIEIPESVVKKNFPSALSLQGITKFYKKNIHTDGEKVCVHYTDQQLKY